MDIVDHNDNDKKSPSTGGRVAVVTPFYNTADYLSECIESVLSQSFSDFEYILVDNASSDGSTEIAKQYAQKDARIRFIRCEELLPQIPNFNRAIKLIAPEAVYCKVALADDLLLPECLQAMITMAESDPEIAVVGAYTVLQNRVFLDGLDFYEKVIDGRVLCSRYFNGAPYIFGTPTTCLYRLSPGDHREDFYDTSAPFEDTDAVISRIIGKKFGFVHQALTFVRTSNDSISAGRERFFVDGLTRRALLERHGHKIFEEAELTKLKKMYASRHYRILGEALLFLRPRKFWEFHRSVCDKVGLIIKRRSIAMGAAVSFFRCFGNLENLARRIKRRYLTIR